MYIPQSFMVKTKDGSVDREKLDLCMLGEIIILQKLFVKMFVKNFHHINFREVMLSS